MIETERLILREWKDSDLEGLIALNASSEVCRYFPSTLTSQESTNMFSKIQSRFESNGFCFYAIEQKSTRNFIGFCGLNTPSFKAHFTPCVEIGWRIMPDYWSIGYATESANAALHEGFARFKMNEIVSFTVPQNTASRRVMEKIGMKYSPIDTFEHPNIPEGHPLKKHVLYRMEKDLFSP